MWLWFSVKFIATKVIRISLTYTWSGYPPVSDPNLASSNETKTVISRTVCFPRHRWAALAFTRVQVRCLKRMPPVNLGLSGIYSKAGRFFGGQEFRSVQPLRMMPSNASFPRDPPAADWISLATTNIAGENTMRIIYTQTLRRELNSDYVHRKTQDCALFFFLDDTR